MSGFLEMLRCILCCEEQEIDDYVRARRISYTNPPQDTYFHTRISYTNPPQDTYFHATATASAPGSSAGLLFPSSSSTSSSTPLIRDHRENQNHTRSDVDSTPYAVIKRYESLLERAREASRSSNNSSSTLYKPPPPQPSFVPSPSPPKKPISSPKPPPSSPGLSPISSRRAPSFKGQSSSSKTTLSRIPSDSTNQASKANYVCLEKGTSSAYVIPEDIKDLIKKDIVPGVLKQQLSPSTYTDYFAALLYAEDFYIEKWSKFQLENVTLDLEEATVYDKSARNKRLNEAVKREEKTFVVLKIDSVRERRPFLLSRDFVFVRPSGRKVEPFQGMIHRVVKSTRVLVEFRKDFHSQHHKTRRYDVSFSFNRVCLTRAHRAVEAASDPLFHNIIFPNYSPRVDLTFTLAIREIPRLNNTAPYLVKGPLCIDREQLSRTGHTVKEAVLQIYRTRQESRVLICAPANKTCDLLMRSLMKGGVPECDMFRANAAFREIDEVPEDILSSCVYERECFACPSLAQLRKMRVVSSTFVSSYRLRNKGVSAGHFSHVFLVDASSGTEPEAMIALANLADEETAVVVTGAPGNSPGWVRSEIARANGLRRSYFERLWNI